MLQELNVSSPASSSSSALSQVDTTSALSVSASALATATATNAIVMADLQDNLIRKLQLELTGALQRELHPLRTELGEVRQAMAEQGKNVNTLAEVVGQNTAFMLKVSAANKRTGQQILALRDQLNRELNQASRPADQMSAVSQDDLFHEVEEYDPVFPTDVRIGEPSPPGLESPATGMQP
jgi:chromosome segregation ATPase